MVSGVFCLRQPPPGILPGLQNEIILNIRGQSVERRSP